MFARQSGALLPDVDFSNPSESFTRQVTWTSPQPIVPCCPLQEHRRGIVPPLPRSLDEPTLPRFEEGAWPQGSVEPPVVLPQFRSLRPLYLRAQGLDTNGASSSASPSDGGAAPRGLRVGVLIGGGNPGHHNKHPAYPVNVLEGLLEYLCKAAPGSSLIGFQGGPEGLLTNSCREITLEDVFQFRNQSSWQCISYGTCADGEFTPKAREAEARRAASACTNQRLDSLVVVAGCRDLSWAAVMADHFEREQHQTKIVGVPYSKNCNFYVPRLLSVTLGFDSARRMLSEVAGNIFTDALSSKKYWHFIRCGEDALTMEVALRTRCTFSVRKAEARSLKETVRRLEEVIERRYASGHHSGVVLLSRELIESLPEMETLRDELAAILRASSAAGLRPLSRHEVEKKIQQEEALELFRRLPRAVQVSLISDTDSRGMPLLPTDLEAERILGRFVQQNMKAASNTHVFAPRFHNMEFMTYAPLPSAFDCAFGYALGQTAGALVFERRTFYVASCMDMHLPVAEWQPVALPFSALYPASACGREDGSLRIPRTSEVLRKNIEEAYEHFKDIWIGANVFQAQGPMQFGDGADVGPLSERPLVLLADCIGLEELKRIIQPVEELPPAVCISSQPTLMRDVRILANLSALEQRRLRYEPEMPTYLQGQLRAQDVQVFPQACDTVDVLAKSFPHTYGKCNAMRFLPVEQTSANPSLGRVESPTLRRPRRVGIVFASNQAPGFHSVIAGVFDHLSAEKPPAELIGFQGGYEGLIKGFVMKIDAQVIDQYRNLGGQDLLCYSSEGGCLVFKDHLSAVTGTIRKQRLDGLVVVGNMEAQVDAAFITEACAAQRLECSVIGVPVSIDCDFPFVQQSIGYDTVCHTLSAYIGQLGCMAQATGRLWIFVRMTGDAWSHIAVQCTLQAHPNIVLLSGSKLHGQSLPGIVQHVCDLIMQRHEAGHDYGMVLLPLGFVQDITELRLLFTEVMQVQANGSYETGWDSIPTIASKLEHCSAALFDLMPRDVQFEICFGGREREGRHNHLSTISTDRLILRFVEIELQRRKDLGFITQDFFRGACHPMLHHARSALPSNFDCDLAYTLGWGAALLTCIGRTGLLVSASNLNASVQDWVLGALPLTSLLRTYFDEEANDISILPANLQLLRQRGIIRPFSNLPAMRDRCGVYRGPLQFWGEATLDPQTRTTWFMENFPIQDPTSLLQDISSLAAELQSMMATAQAESRLYAVNSILTNALSTLDTYKALDASSRRLAQSLADVAMSSMVWKTNVEEGGPPRRSSSSSLLDSGCGPRQSSASGHAWGIQVSPPDGRGGVGDRALREIAEEKPSYR